MSISLTRVNSIVGDLSVSKASMRVQVYSKAVFTFYTFLRIFNWSYCAHIDAHKLAKEDYLGTFSFLKFIGKKYIILNIRFVEVQTTFFLNKSEGSVCINDPVYAYALKIVVS